MAHSQDRYEAEYYTYFYRGSTEQWTTRMAMTICVAATVDLHSCMERRHRVWRDRHAVILQICFGWFHM